MPLSGHGMTISSTTVFASALGSEVEEIDFGGIDVTTINVACLGDTNRVSANEPGEVTEGPLQVTIVSDTDGDREKACRDAEEAQTVESFTVTDSDGSTWIGDAFVSDVGDVNVDTKDVAKFTISIQPETYFAFTA